MLLISVNAQDIAFVNPYSSPIYLNPAFAGYEGCSRISSSFNNQWTESEYDYYKSTSSYDQYVKQLHGSIALRYMYDSQGGYLHTLNGFHATYSPTFKFYDKKLLISPAVEIGWHKYGYNGYLLIPGLLNYNNSLDVYLTPFNVLDFNFGILISHTKFVYGAAVHHLTEPPLPWRQASDAVLSRKYTMHFSYLWDINEKHILSPTLHLEHQKYFQVFNSALAYSYSHFRTAIGIGMNPKFHYNTFNFHLGYHKKWYSIKYGYEVIVSKLKNHSTLGRHEISLITTFNCKNKKENRKGPELINF